VKARLFGTDGMRGVALQPPLDQVTVSRLGGVLAAHLKAAGQPCRILLAGDTRASTNVLASWLGGAFVAAGGELDWAGVLPTPAVSLLVRDDGRFGAGVIVSASHNPAADNGIKLVSGAGAKWPTREEHLLEDRLMAATGSVPIAPIGDAETSGAQHYIAHLAGTLPPGTLVGLRLVVDAANGAASHVAAPFFERLGATVEVINGSPDGTNINAGCGALHPEGLAARVRESAADAGVALDGDADRTVLVTRSGRVLNGDDVLWVWGRHLNATGRLPNRALVATVMSNLGLEIACSGAGLALTRCPVGDREVWEAMQRVGAALGGEQSGHIICAHHAVTGDGLLTAAHVLAAAHESGVDLDTLADLEHFPQVLRNVKVGSRRPIDQVSELHNAIAEQERLLAGQGRVFVRYSGTEPLLRIMVEAPSKAAALETAAHLEAVALASLGPAQ
jgi:phosphoglucosamine mutase